MKDTTINIGGNPYRVSALDARQTQEFLDYARRTMPDPVDEVLDVAAKLPEAMREKFIEGKLNDAFERKKLRGTLTDPDLETFISRPEGYRKLFALMFKRHHPHLTEEQCFDLVVQGVEEHGEGVFSALYRSGVKVPMAEEDIEENFFRGGRATRKTKVVR